MLQNLPIQDSLVVELLEIEAKLEPLETRKEELKEALRGFGANKYETAVGTVSVSQPSISKKTGEKLVVHDSVLPKLAPTTYREVFDKGLLSYEDVFSRQAKAKVEILLNA